MLPKLAANLLHASRAAAAHGQAVNFRNVLQFQTSFPPPSSVPATASSFGTSTSGWGSPAGAGGANAKYHAGGRFYSGYAGSGSAIAHANSSAADGGSGQTDDNEDRAAASASPPFRAPSTLRTRPSRTRSSSFSSDAEGRDERGRELGVLHAVQMHVRNRHAFTGKTVASELPDPSFVLLIDSRPHHVAPAADASTPRVLTRRNSMSSSTTSVSGDPASFLPMQPSPGKSTGPQRSDHDATDALAVANRLEWEALKAARSTGNWEIVRDAVAKFRVSPNPNVQGYNMAIDAILVARAPGQPITAILELYNDMLSRNIRPNIQTYKFVITALCVRDHDVERVLSSMKFDHRGTLNSSADQRDLHVAEQLRNEGNFASALALFDVAAAAGLFFRYAHLYNELLRCCAHHGDADAARRVYARMRLDKEVLREPSTFSHLVRTFSLAGDVEAATQAFDEFLVAPDHVDRPALYVKAYMGVWNSMIRAHIKAGQPEKALDLLAQMMDSSPSTPSIPTPSTSTYSNIIVGFCDTGDVPSALAWFDRMLSEGIFVSDVYAPLNEIPLPDGQAWSAMLLALAERNAIEDFNRLYLRAQDLMQDRKLPGLPLAVRIHATELNLSPLLSPELDQAFASAHIDFLLTHLSQQPGMTRDPPHIARASVERFVEALVLHGRTGEAASLTLDLAKTQFAALRSTRRGVAPQHDTATISSTLSACVSRILGASEFGAPPVRLSLASAIDLLNGLAAIDRDLVLTDFNASLVDLYIIAKSESIACPQLTAIQWTLLVDAFSSAALQAASSNHAAAEQSGHASLLSDVSTIQDRALLEGVNRKRLAQALIAVYPYEQAKSLLESFDPSATAYLVAPSPAPSHSSLGFASLENSSSPSMSSVDLESSALAAQPQVTIDIQHSRFVDEHQYNATGVTPAMAFDRVQLGLQRHFYPSPETLGRLINVLGRQSELDKVQSLYRTAQTVLAQLEHDKVWQSQGWFQVEDNMIIAYAHAGDLDTAGVHRVRVIENGGVPSADAYGALISCVRDTTDDASIARELFEESQCLGVRANIFLYNTIISKLSRARKADYAVELFQRMRRDGLRPTSVTYGAVIGACCRVGDEVSAAVLFDEMTTMPNFKPRVPPYNTMIQFFTQTKPNRERALHYYNELRAAGVQPSAHTYKLLIDAHGAVEPVDMKSAEQVFAQLVADRSVAVQGTHWAALINAWGCASKDIDRAIAVFESIASHPSSQRSRTSLPDAVVFESLINVFVTLHRMELVPQYLQRLRDSNIHATAYIMNLLIKGYAAAGDMDKARETFASLQDPPTGVAAPNNHLAHDPSSSSPSTNGPCYREPSTWEAMVRAELGAGNRQTATDLLDRMEARMFPPAVAARIRGIMREDSMIPL